MGLGGTSQSGPITYLSARARKDKKTNPHFTVQRPAGNNQYDHLPDVQAISGYLVSIGHKEYEWEGKKNMALSLMLVDNGERFKIDFGMNSNYGRGLMNTIAGTRDFDYMEIRLYAKNDQANMFISNNGEKTAWKFKWKEELAPLIYEVEDPKTGDMVKVYRKVDALLFDAWIAVEAYVNDRARKMGYDKKAGVPEKSEDNSLHSEFDNQDPETKRKVDGFHQPPADDFEPTNNSVNDDLPF